MGPGAIRCERGGGGESEICCRAVHRVAVLRMLGPQYPCPSPPPSLPPSPTHACTPTVIPPQEGGHLSSCNSRASIPSLAAYSPQQLAEAEFEEEALALLPPSLAAEAGRGGKRKAQTAAAPAAPAPAAATAAATATAAADAPAPTGGSDSGSDDAWHEADGSPSPSDTFSNNGGEGARPQAAARRPSAALPRARRSQPTHVAKRMRAAAPGGAVAVPKAEPEDGEEDAARCALSI
jgi:hypothetical protein